MRLIKSYWTRYTYPATLPNESDSKRFMGIQSRCLRLKENRMAELLYLKFPLVISILLRLLSDVILRQWRTQTVQVHC